MELTCAFTGHRPERLPFPDEQDPACIRLKAALAEQVERLAKTNVRHFITGLARGVDTWAAEAVLALQNDLPNRTLTGVLPCGDQAASWPRRDRERHGAILARCDSSVTLFPAYVDGCMLMRDRWLVEHADLLLAVYDGARSGGTAYTVCYAVSREKKVVLLDPVTLEVSYV